MTKLKKFVKYFVPGVFGGFLNGFFGGGGGLLLVPMFKRMSGLDAVKAHATSVFAMFVISISSVLIYLRAGNIDFSYCLPLSIGGVIGGFLGALFLKRINPFVLKKGFALFLLYSSFRLWIK